MSFTVKDWQNSPSTATPLNATAMEDLETRLSGYTDNQTAATVYTPEAYGATGNGTTDDTAAFQAMIDAAYAIGTPAHFRLRPVTYLLDSAPRTDRLGRSILSVTAALTSKATIWEGAGPGGATATTLKSTRTSDTGYASGPSTTLSAQLTAGATSASLTSAASFPTQGVAVVAGAEVIRWGGKSSNTLTGVTRGLLGTSDLTRANGSTIAQTYGIPSLIGCSTFECSADVSGVNWTGLQVFRNFKIQLEQDSPLAGIDGYGMGGIEVDNVGITRGTTYPPDVATSPMAVGFRTPTSYDAGHVLLRRATQTGGYAGLVVFKMDHAVLTACHFTNAKTAIGFEHNDPQGAPLLAHPPGPSYVMAEYNHYTLAGWSALSGAISLATSSGAIPLNDITLDVETLASGNHTHIAQVLDANSKLEGNVRMFNLNSLWPNPSGVYTGATRLEVEVCGYRGATVPQVASVAGTMTLPPDSKVWEVTGTNAITNIGASWAGREVTLIFSSTASCTDGAGNLFLVGNFTGAGGKVLKLVASGGFWYEVSRSLPFG